MKRYTKFYILAIVLVLFDQITKLSVKGFNLFGIEHSGMEYGEVIPVIGNFLQWTYIENQGMAFGISFGWGKIFLSLFSLVASGFIVWYLHKVSDKLKILTGIAITLILAGAFGNCIDRCLYGVLYGTAPLFYGGVVDFIMVNIPDIDLFGLHYSHFPIFNVADSCVTCGVILLLFMHNNILSPLALKSNDDVRNDEI